ncbi:hypothetical protein K523DRAFT_244942 [Schizophyllum commune Tattone D]|nr:hypothetical protein K523DRAFT_244942 [Schizophyllum commune Tattone D]
MNASSAYSEEEIAAYARLYEGNLIPMYATVVGLAWVYYDWGASLLTLRPQVRYVWPQKMNVGKAIYLWIQWLARIHPAMTNPMLCIIMDPVDRLSGAVLLWSVEIIMQLRIYAIYERSAKVAYVNILLFLISIAGFFYVLITNVLLREDAIKHVLDLPLMGCPAIQTATEWAQWLPATIFEGILFGFVLYRSFRINFRNLRAGRGVSLYEVIIKDQIRYWVGISTLLVLCNLMVVGTTKIPWFGFGPFHAGLGVSTTRMLLNIREAAERTDYSIYLGTSPPARARKDRSDDSETLNKFTATVEFRPSRSVESQWDEEEETMEMGAMNSERIYGRHDLEARPTPTKAALDLAPEPTHTSWEPTHTSWEPMHSQVDAAHRLTDPTRRLTDTTRSPSKAAPQS